MKTCRVNADRWPKQCDYLVIIVLFLLCMPGSITGCANGQVQCKDGQKNSEISPFHRVSRPLPPVQYPNTNQGIREPLIASQENGDVNNSTPQQAKTKRAVRPRQRLLQSPITNFMLNRPNMHKKKTREFTKKHPRVVTDNDINKRKVMANDTVEMLNIHVTFVGDLGHGDPRGVLREHLAQKNGREYINKRKVMANDTVEMLNINVTFVGDLDHGDPRGVLKGDFARKNGREYINKKQVMANDTLEMLNINVTFAGDLDHGDPRGVLKGDFARKNGREYINKKQVMANDTLEMLNINVTFVGDLSRGDPRGVLRGYLAQKNGREHIVVQKNKDALLPVGQRVSYHFCSDMESCKAIVNRRKDKDSRIVCNEKKKSCYVIGIPKQPSSA